jgi:hypothetical protein
LVFSSRSEAKFQGGEEQAFKPKPPFNEIESGKISFFSMSLFEKSIAVF